MKVKNSRTV